MKKNYFLSFILLCLFNLEFSIIAAQTCGVGKSEFSGTSFGGENTTEEAWPWSVAFVNRQKEKIFCGGTLISAKHVLSAAHCFQKKNNRYVLNPFLVEALLGKFNLSIENEIESETLLVSEIVIHPDWNEDRVKYDADLSVVVLERKVTFSDFIQPICLPEQSDDPVTGTGTVVRWGKSGTSGGASVIVSSKLQVPAIDHAACYTAIPAILRYPTTRTFCGSYDELGKAPCLGGSGGGFYLRNKDDFFAVQGIISGSETDRHGCASNKITFFTHVAKFADWIKKIVRETMATNNLIVRFSCEGDYDLTLCSTYFQYPMTRNLKIRADFPRHEIQNIPINVTNLNLNFSPSTHISSGVGNEFPNLIRLKVQGESIEFMERQSFAKMTQLDYLEIKHTSVDFLPQDLLADLPNLTNFKINFCFQLESFPKKFFINQRKVKSLGLSANRITILQRDLFKNNLKLQEVHLWSNSLKEIYVDFTLLPAVEWIDLREGQCIDQNWRPINESIQSFQDKINRDCQPLGA